MIADAPIAPFNGPATDFQDPFRGNAPVPADAPIAPLAAPTVAPVAAPEAEAIATPIDAPPEAIATPIADPTEVIATPIENPEKEFKANALKSIADSTVEQLALDKSRDLHQFFTEHRNELSDADAHKLADAQELRNRNGMTLEDVTNALKHAGPNVYNMATEAGKSVVRTAPGISGLAATAKGVFDEIQKGKSFTDAFLDYNKRVNAENFSGAENRGAELLGLLRTGLRKVVNYRGPDLSKLPVIGNAIPPLPDTRVEGDITHPESFLDRHDNFSTFVHDAEAKQAIAKTAEGQGATAEFLGQDSDTLAKQGVHLDPAYIRGASTLVDPMTWLPAVEGLKVAKAASGYEAVNAAGQVVARSATEAPIAAFVGKVTEKAATLAGKAAEGTLDKVSGLAGGVAAGLSKNFGRTGLGSTAALIGALTGHVSIPTLLGGAAVKYIAQGVAKGVSHAASAVAPVAGELASAGVKAGSRVAQGAAAGAAYSLPFAAAMDEPSEQANVIATGGAIGAAAAGAHTAPQVARDGAIRAKEIILSHRWQEGADLGPIQASVLKTPGLENFEAAHQANRETVASANPNEAAKLDLLRAGLKAKGTEAYLMTPEQATAANPELADKEGAVPITIKDANGKDKSVLAWITGKNGSVNALVHEPGHSIFNLAQPAAQNELLDSFSDGQVAAFKKEYLSSPGLTPEQRAAVTDSYVRNELAAEAIGHVADGRGLAGTPANIREKVAGVLTGIMEKVGAYNPGVREGYVGPADANVTRYGTEQSHSSAKMAEGIFNKFAQDPEVSAAMEQLAKQGESKPSAAPKSPEAAKPATPAAPVESADKAIYAKFKAGSFEKGIADSLYAKLAKGPLSPRDTALWNQIFPGIEVPGAAATPSTPPPLPKLVTPPPIQPRPKPTGEPTITTVDRDPGTPPPLPKESQPELPTNPTPAAPPNVRGVEPKDYTNFSGPAREPAQARVASAAETIAADPNLSPEVKAANATLVENNRKPVSIVYDSAAEVGSKNAESYRQRREEVEAARNDPGLRAAASKLGVIPLDAATTSKGVQHIVWSGDAALVNIDRVLKQAAGSGNESLVPYPMKDGKLVDGGAQLAQDLINYTANQNNGYKGNGGKLARPENPAGFIPDENPDYTPVNLSEQTANFANLIMGEPPPITARKPQAGTTPVPIRANAIAKANQRIGAFTGLTYEAPAEFKGQGIHDYNPLRQQMEAAGMNVRELNPVHERLDASRIKSATPMPDVKLQPTSTDVTAAGFLPVKDVLGEAPGKQKIEVEFNGIKYPASLDGYQDFTAIGGKKLAQITTLADIPGTRFIKGGTTYDAALVKDGVKVHLPAEPTPEPVSKTTDSPNFLPEKNPAVAKSEENYTKSAGIPYNPHVGYSPLNKELGQRVADAYDAMKNDPSDPKVAAAYGAMTKEVKAQWDQLVADGVKPEPWTQPGQPYKNSAELRKDVSENKHLYYFPTESGFGTGSSEANPMLAPSGVKVNGADVPVNDIFRAVHDYYGHAKDGFEFGPRGEYNAFLSHSRMFTPEAVKALATETMGQNSWVNFGEHVRNKDVPVTERPYAEQKAGLLPDALINESLSAPSFMPAKTEAGKIIEEQGLKLTQVQDPQSKTVHFAWRNSDHEPVSSLTVGLQGNGKATVRMVTTDKNVRGHGLAEALYREAGTYLQSVGVTKLTGDVFSDGPVQIRRKVFGEPVIRPFPVEGGVGHVTSKIDPMAKFLPSKDPEAIRSAAIQLRNGKIFEGMYHGSALDKANEGRKHELSIADYVDGFTDNSGNFLTRDEAYDRAIKLKQINRRAAVEDGMSYDNSGETGMLESTGFRATRQFLPKKATGWTDVAREMLADPEHRDNINDFLGGRKALLAAAVEMDKKGVTDAAGLDEISTNLRDTADALFAHSQPEVAPTAEVPISRKKSGPPKSTAKGESFDVTHYSSQAGLTTVDPKFFGKGKATATDLRGSPKSFFFVKDSDFGQDVNLFKDAGLHEYHGTIAGDKLYDLRLGKKDPLKWRETVNREKADESVKDAGYDGMILDTADGRKIVAMFKSVPVSKNRPSFAPAKRVPGGPEEVDQAAIRFEDGQVFTGVAHWEAYDKASTAGLTDDAFRGAVDGFVTTHGRFLDRADSYKLAVKSGQMTPREYAQQNTQLSGFGPERLESEAFNNVLNDEGPAFLPRREPIVDQLELGKPLPPVDRYSRAYTNKLTQEQMRDYFPEAIIGKEGDIKSDLVGSPLVRREGEAKAAKIVGDKLVQFYKDSTAPGNPTAEVTKLGQTWYSRFAPELKKFFGKDTQLFAELLAATSPNTNPSQNFKMATEAYKLYKNGWYDDLVAGFNEGFTKLNDGTLYQDYTDAVPKSKQPENISDATLMKWWVESQNLKPTKAPRINGKTLSVEDDTLFGISSAAVLKVAARKWMTENTGPKTAQFVRNLTGVDNGATIDVWADRTLREATYAGDKKRWRILPENSSAVSDADFAFGQAAFKHAADKLGIEPSALQGALWFAEKAKWAENGWSPLNLGDFMPHLEELQARGDVNKLLADVPPSKIQALNEVEIRRKDLLAAQKALKAAERKNEVEIRRAEKRQKTLF